MLKHDPLLYHSLYPPLNPSLLCQFNPCRIYCQINFQQKEDKENKEEEGNDEYKR